MAATESSQWTAAPPPRRSISTVTVPDRRQISQFYQDFFPERCTPEVAAAQQQGYYQPHQQPYSHDTNFYNNGQQQRQYYDPSRFSPPRTPPVAEHEQFVSPHASAPPPHSITTPEAQVHGGSLGVQQSQQAHQMHSPNGPPSNSRQYPSHSQGNNSWHDVKMDSFVAPTQPAHNFRKMSTPAMMMHRSPQPMHHEMKQEMNMHQQMAQMSSHHNVPQHVPMQQMPLASLHPAATHQMTSSQMTSSPLDDELQRNMQQMAYPDLGQSYHNMGGQNGGGHNMQRNTPAQSAAPVRKHSMMLHPLEVECGAGTGAGGHAPLFTLSNDNHSIDMSPHSDSPESSRKTSQPSQNMAHRKISTVVVRKASEMANLSQLRNPRGAQPPSTTASLQPGFTPFTPAPILNPMRNGSGLFWTTRKQSSISPLAPSAVCGNAAMPSHEDMEHDEASLRIEEGAVDGDDQPHRKNGFFPAATSSDQFAEQLDNLRKESLQSTASRKVSIDPGRLLDESEQVLRKCSTMSDSAYAFYDASSAELQAHRTDSTPHLNLGKEYQARVKKWADREISREEREAIADRDEKIFDPEVISHLDKAQLDAYELLSCSQAVPMPGHNKELALHILFENSGNIEAAVVDLLRCDTLDWKQYNTVLHSHFPETTPWSPEEVNTFQDAIYKTEKDFHQVAKETNKTVNECVEFYYTWKKACPDDYRKLRNLRRKRHMLEMSLQAQDRLLGDYSPPVKRISEEESEMQSDAESDATAPSFTNEHLFSEMRMGGMCSPLSGAPRKSSAASMGSLSSLSVVPLLMNQPPSPSMKDFSGLQHKYQPTTHRGSMSMGSSSNQSKKGAQPSADGFFHCRLCDKCFEKVKSLNAHMKSHAMKARAEAEAQAQAQLREQHGAVNSMSQNLQQQLSNLGQLGQLGQLGHGLGQGLAQASLGQNLGLQQQLNPALNTQLTQQLGLGQSLGLQGQGLVTPQQIQSSILGQLVHPQAHHPLLPGQGLVHPTLIQ